MTVVAAVATERGVVMGADVAATVDGSFVMKAHGTPKIHTIFAAGEPIMFGVAGNGAIGPTIAQKLDVGDLPSRYSPDREVDQWANVVAVAITEILADANPPLVSPDGDSAPGMEGVVLMAFRHHLWYVTTHQALRPEDGVAAIGSGSDVALGSLHTGLAAGHDPDDALREAIEWARISGPRLSMWDPQPPPNRAQRRRCLHGRKRHHWVMKDGYGEICHDCGTPRATRTC